RKSKDKSKKKESKKPKLENKN
ncbi:hypothetical protein A3Q56_08517, partial [Intoshia linei]